MIKTELDYVSGKTLLEEGQFGISPSGINNFITKPHEWYREHVLGEEGFRGSTASVLGTICHYCAESVTKSMKKDGKPYVNVEEIYNHIYNETVLIKNDEEWLNLTAYMAPEDMEARELKWTEYLQLNANNPEIDASVILDQWKPMANALVKAILSKSKVPDKAEELIKTEIIPGFFASGSADAWQDGCLIDYKTTSDKTPKDYIPSNYKYQLLTYAYIYNQLGIKTDRIRIVWVTRNEVNRISEKTGKPLKDYPTQVVEVTEQVSQNDMEFIESVLKLIAETVQASRDYPELTHCLFKDYRLKK